MLEGELESEFEGEGVLGNMESTLGGLLGDSEGEEEMGLHELHENGYRELHEGTMHESGLHELESEFELEGETGEQFFGKIFRGVRNLVKRAAPLLKRVASIAAPMVATAIGGPFGGLIGKAAGSLLGDGEGEMGLQELGLHEGEFEMPELQETGLHETYETGMHELEGGMYEGEFEMQEGSHEAAYEITNHELTHHEALAEMMAQQAAFEQHEAQAEAMVGAAVMTTLSPRDRRKLRRVLPHLVRGVAILTRVLRRRRITRPAVRAVPTVVRRTVQVLKNQAAAGKPVTRRTAARAAAIQVRRVIGNPTACAAAISQNIRANKALNRYPAIDG
jgi:hypothetical protein